MFGQQFRCTKCDFSFCTGWSHHEGGQFVICRGCAAFFVAESKRSAWGAEEGEELELIRRRDKPPRRRRTRIMVAYRSGGRARESGVFLGLAAALAAVACPACKQAAALAETLAPGEACPQCKTGKIRAAGGCIY